MKPKTSKKKVLGATPGQLALIGVLAVILLVALIVQLGGGDSESADQSPTAEKTDARSSATNETNKQAAGQEPSKQQRPRPWPKIDLHQTIAVDPFALREPLAAVIQPPPPPASEQQPQETESQRRQILAQALADLQSRGVSMILRSDKGRYAAIGGRTVQVGDLLGGFRVKEITGDGVVLEVAQPE